MRNGSRLSLAIAFWLVAVAIGATRAQDTGGAGETDARSRLDQKRVGARYRVKVVSAGVPTLGGFLEGFKCRTTYRVVDKDGKLQGAGFLNDYVYVDGPGEYSISVHGVAVKETFDVPPEMTPDRVQASWRRARAIELRPKSGARLAVPCIWVLHPPEVQGEHNDDFEVDHVFRTETGSIGFSKVTSGVAVVYPPEEIRDIDDGVLYDNTLVHVWPGNYDLVINGTHACFNLAAGETKLVRLGALVVHDAKPLAQTVESSKPDAPIVTESKLEKPPVVGRFFVVAPGTYESGSEKIAIAPGGVGSLYGVKRPFGDKPRLGVKATDAPKDEGALVAGFTEGSAAAAAGVKVGDRIVSIDGKPVKGFDDLIKGLESKKPGDEVELSVVRSGRPEPMAIKVKLGG